MDYNIVYVTYYNYKSGSKTVENYLFPLSTNMIRTIKNIK